MLANHRRALFLLVGWYLVIPPTPLSPQWSLVASFNSPQDCREYLENVQQQVAIGSPLSYSDQFAHIYSQARCIEIEERLAT